MARPSDNETWIIETGDVIIQKQHRHGDASLSNWERLVYCLWVADYGIRNAGDFDAARQVEPTFESMGLRLAHLLQLPLASALFALSESKWLDEYDERFDLVCEELKSASSK
jgi:hypothetical protein